MDGLVVCCGCKNFARAPHATRAMREDFRWFHRQQTYTPPKGCRLTGEHLASGLPRRCDKFEGKE